jgi:hypothetical protein
MIMNRGERETGRPIAEHAECGHREREGEEP